MSTILSIQNFSDRNVKETTALNLDAPIGSTALTVSNNQNIAANDYLLVGNPGGETTEILAVSSVATAVTVNTAATTLIHNRFDPVRALVGNQIRIYTAPNVSGLQPADTAFTTILATIAIDPDQAQTIYTDATGTSNTWYKFTYYNSTTTSETSLADSTSARGGGVGNYCSIEQIRNQGVKSRYISDSTIDQKRQAAQSEINGALVGHYAVPFVAPINPFIVDLTARLAAGLILTTQYGIFSTLNTTNGKALLDEARKQLVALQTDSADLVDSNGNSIGLTTPGASAVEGWPNETTDLTGSNLTPGDIGNGYDYGSSFTKAMKF
jgi:hypothetical protein